MIFHSVMIHSLRHFLRRTCQFTPAIGNEGKYLINITATDGMLNNTRILNLVIAGANKAPIITNITDRITVYRNQTFHINVTACDPDLDAGCE